MMISSIFSAAMLVAAEPNISTVVEIRPYGQEYSYAQRDIKVEKSNARQDEALFKEEVAWLKTRQSETHDANEDAKQVQTNTKTHTHIHIPQQKAAVLYFGFDRSKLRKTESQKLGNFNTNDTVIVTGYASKEGTRGHNNKLSERRAEAVAQALRAHGVKIKKLEHFGEECKEKPNELCRKAEVKSGD